MRNSKEMIDLLSVINSREGKTMNDNELIKIYYERFQKNKGQHAPVEEDLMDWMKNYSEDKELFIKRPERK